MNGVKEVDEQEALARLEKALNCAMAVQNTAYERAMVLWGIRPPDPPEMAEMAEMLKLRHFKLQGLSI